jgi:hypothetical protein
MVAKSKPKRKIRAIAHTVLLTLQSDISRGEQYLTALEATIKSGVSRTSIPNALKDPQVHPHCQTCLMGCIAENDDTPPRLPLG